MANPLGTILKTLNNSQEQKNNPALYQAIKALISAVTVIDDAARSAGIISGGVIPLPSPTVTDLDGTNDPGLSSKYSRGDHKHGINLFESTIVLTNAQIKALPTTPLVLVAAPGAGIAYVPISINLHSDFTAGAYTNVNADSYLGAYIGDWFSNFIGNDSSIPITFLSDFLSALELYVQLVSYTFSQQIVNWGNLAFNFGPNMANNPIGLYFENNGSGNLTGGNAANTLTVTTFYFEMSF